LCFLFFGARSLMSSDERSFLAYMKEIGQYFVGDEYALRLGIFISNKRYIREFNKNDMRSFSVGLSHFAHLTPSEYRGLLGVKHTGKPRNGKAFVAKEDFNGPKELDWRDKGVVSEIKNQGFCGSCWAFSVIAAQEAQWAIQHSDLFTLSPSNMIDCCYSCMGCNGCYTFTALDDIIEYQGGSFMKEVDYPYVERKDDCRFDVSKAVARVKSYEIVDMGNENDLLQAVNQGVVSVCIDASLQSFQLYKTGIYDDELCSIWGVDHAVACVGYGVSASTEFWIVKNSWGTKWGESGYMRMVRGKNMCGIAIIGILPHAA
jgi:cathepsin L